MTAYRYRSRASPGGGYWARARYPSSQIFWRTLRGRAAPLLRAGGMLVDWRGRRVAAEELAAARAAEELGLARVGVERVQPSEDARDRNLHLYLKVRETPARFPRRAGMARKRPLGG